MGVYSDLLASAITIDVEAPREGNDRAVVRAIRSLMDRQGDLDYPSGYEATDEVQELGTHEAGTDAGTYQITVNLNGGVSFTTAALGHDDNGSAIQTAIDTAADGVVDGYTAGDIAVTGGPLTTDAVVLTFSGGSVSAQAHPLAEIVNVDLNDGGTPTDAGDVTVTTEGQSNRTAWAILRVSGVISGTPPTQGESGTVVADTNRHNNPFYPDQDTIRALAHEAAVADGNGDVETAILSAVGL